MIGGVIVFVARALTIDYFYHPHHHPHHPHHPHHSHHPHPHDPDQVIDCLLRTLFILSATSLPRSTSSLRWLVNIQSGHFCFSGKGFFFFNIVVNIRSGHFCFSGKKFSKYCCQHKKWALLLFWKVFSLILWST